MGLSSAFGSLVRGRFGEAFNYAFVDEDTIAAQKSVSDNLSSIVQRQYAEGLINDEEKNVFMHDLAGTAYPYLFEEFPDDTPGAGFRQGFVEGADNIRGAIGKGISGVFGITARLIPWQLWLIGGVVALIWLWPYIGPVVMRLAPKAK